MIYVTVADSKRGDYHYDQIQQVIGHVNARINEMVGQPRSNLIPAVFRIHRNGSCLEVYWTTPLWAFRYGNLLIDAWKEVAHETLLKFFIPGLPEVTLNSDDGR
jgi:hypothetical protein